MAVNKNVEKVTKRKSGPVIFRPQRGSLEKAMSEAKEFRNFREMKKFVVKSWNDGWQGDGDLFTIDDIVINTSHVVDDPRNGWEDTMYVCIKRLGKEIYKTPQCIGMCATRYPKSSW